MTIELAIDIEQIETPEKAEVLHLLAKAAPLRVSRRSKAGREHELAEGKAVEALAGNEMIVQAGSSAAEAFRTIRGVVSLPSGGQLEAALKYRSSPLAGRVHRSCSDGSNGPIIAHASSPTTLG